ncbi:hypothetical protein V5O48_010074 [Marasmius crinis-equi]|uniref:VWFA domain-containing protein n=1 Tax=Marasmius crinis-equi TaxID=585013 RepID=A0ABR3F9D6_9AGAR
MGIFSSSEDKLLLRQLAKFDTVIILDDSSSMRGENWKQAGKALSKLASEAAKYDQDGIEIQFLNNQKSFDGLRSSDQIKKVFEEVRPLYGTPLGWKLRVVLERYISRYEVNKKSCKPVNFIVITDGVPTDQEVENRVAHVIVEFARRLDELDALSMQVGIQFVQVGNDETASEFLRALDDDLKHRYDIRDMVDTTVSVPGESLDVVKTLLGAINRRVDNSIMIPKQTLGERIKERFLS